MLLFFVNNVKSKKNIEKQISQLNLKFKKDNKNHVSDDT